MVRESLNTWNRNFYHGNGVVVVLGNFKYQIILTGVGKLLPLAPSADHELMKTRQTKDSGAYSELEGVTPVLPPMPKEFPPPLELL